MELAGQNIIHDSFTNRDLADYEAFTEHSILVQKPMDMSRPSCVKETSLWCWYGFGMVQLQLLLNDNRSRHSPSRSLYQRGSIKTLPARATIISTSPIVLAMRCRRTPGVSRWGVSF